MHFFGKDMEKGIPDVAAASPGIKGRVNKRNWILVMDDDAMMRHVICSMLESIGCRPYGTASCEEAVSSYLKAKECGYVFDVVVMDLHVVDGKGGREALRELLAMDPRARVVVTSGDIYHEAMTDHRSFGFCGALKKPFTLEQLDEAVRSALPTRGSTGAQCADC